MKLRKWRKWASGLCLVLIEPTAVSAQASDATMRLLTAEAPSDAFASAQSRDLLVDAADAYCREVRQAFPLNSPAEAAWLDEELRSKDNNRMMRAMDSAEYGRRIAEIFATDCIGFAAVYKAKGRSLGLVGLGLAFSRFQYAQWAAKKNGVAPDKFAFGVVGSFAAPFLSAWIAMDR